MIWRWGRKVLYHLWPSNILPHFFLGFGVSLCGFFSALFYSGLPCPCYLSLVFDKKIQYFPPFFCLTDSSFYFYAFCGQISRAEYNIAGESKPSSNIMALPHSWSPLTFPAVLHLASPPSCILEGFHGVLCTWKLIFPSLKWRHSNVTEQFKLPLLAPLPWWHPHLQETDYWLCLG